jgi:hypothetical protein
MKRQSSKGNVGVLCFACAVVMALAILVSSATVFAASSWSVFCNKDLSVVYADTTQIGFSSAGMKFWAGPFKTDRQAKEWIAKNCPKGLCTTDGKCAGSGSGGINLLGKPVK